MKKILITGILFTFILGTINAQDFSDVKAKLNNLLELSKAKSYDKAASLIAYQGDDKARENTAFDATKKDELEKVKRICKKISALIDLSSKYDVGEVKNTSTETATSFNVEVTFTSGTQKLATLFTFTKTDKGLLLTNMN